jgi:hypothetical protein
MAAPSKVARLRASVESSFGADRTGTISNFYDIRSEAMQMPEPVRAQLVDERLRQKVWEQPLNVQGFKSAAFDVKGKLVSHGLMLTNGTANTKDALSKILEVLAGGYASSTGTLVASGGATTGFVMTAGNGATAGIEPGTIIPVETALGSNLYVCNLVSTRVTDTIVTQHQFGFTPAVGAKVLGAQMIYPTSAPSGTLQWLFDSYERTNILNALGCQGDLKIEWVLGQLVMWATSQKAATWLYDADLATTQSGSGIGVVTAVSYEGGTPIPATAGNIVISPTSGTLRTLPSVSKLEFDLGLNRVSIESFNATDTGGVGAYSLVPNPVTGKFVVPRDSLTYQAARDAGTKYRIFAQAGNTAGNMLAIAFPCVQITGVKPVDANGLQYSEVSWMALMNEGSTDQSTDFRAAPWYLGRC